MVRVRAGGSGGNEDGGDVAVREEDVDEVVEGLTSQRNALPGLIALGCALLLGVFAVGTALVRGWGTVFAAHPLSMGVAATSMVVGALVYHLGDAPQHDRAYMRGWHRLMGLVTAVMVIGGLVAVFVAKRRDGMSLWPHTFHGWGGLICVVWVGLQIGSGISKLSTQERRPLWSVVFSGGGGGGGGNYAAVSRGGDDGEERLVPFKWHNVGGPFLVDFWLVTLSVGAFTWLGTDWRAFLLLLLSFIISIALRMAVVSGREERRRNEAAAWAAVATAPLDDSASISSLDIR